jgi:hypothetical protein
MARLLKELLICGDIERCLIDASIWSRVGMLKAELLGHLVLPSLDEVAGSDGEVGVEQVSKTTDAVGFGSEPQKPAIGIKAIVRPASTSFSEILSPR